MSRIAVIGAGAWGTALANTYAANGHQIALWTIETDHAEEMRAERSNRRYLPDFPLEAGLVIAHEFADACRDAELVLIATPVAGLRPTLKRVAAEFPALPALWVCKGFEAGTGKLPHEVAAEFLAPAVGRGALTGPSFAQEVAAGLPCAITLASADIEFARYWAGQLMHPRLRLYANDDIVGAEIGGAVKNVLAIAAGISDGLGFGFNARAALLTRGLAEIARLSAALGGRRDTLMGLAGMGDLILTATGDLSRNRRVGLALAEGKQLPQILKELGHVAEGVLTTETVVKRATELGVDMPITWAVQEVLCGRLNPRDAVEQLMTREARLES
ncbi:NAD(P)H-dependent glycerol-3-phosphate dehydrogenase [Uliginosibacterium sp. 31-16]|uniref:NAD(P)H-dependent glycerol-3-phosphate dehydrogenase n=1 Tax=Uliginosibacterium sp. 31-16 TaxID=3068315 RepID=UPI00273F7D5E|nr:NAD(P)H-dependent glycerol-3-phosphate dehydrogenase [Uliginosibacterium sp. 31-16]MDP5239778.1 NAD(P)H-dependent glycerol-3-phosphate dehydrogenase [Uliginosibacterium sp. 31-16]